MDSIIGYKVKASPEKKIADRECRFCMLQCEENEVLRIPWNEWRHSLLAAMYERIMNQEVSCINVNQAQETQRTVKPFQLFISEDCSEFCCNKCSQLLSQTVAALDMFQRSDAFWRTIFKDSNPMIEPKSEYLVHSEDDLEALNDDVEKAVSEPNSLFTMGLIKTEVIDNERSEFGELVDKQSDTVHEEMDIFAEVLKVCNVIKEDKGEFDKKRITKPSETMNIQPFPCSQCDELCRTRLLLTRHMINVHNLRLCVRCNFTTSDRLDSHQSIKKVS